MSPKVPRNEGFTLIELALAIAIAGLLLAAGLTGISAQRQVMALRETQALLDAAREALVGYAAVHGRLPRPAVSDQDGSERTTACLSDMDCTGYLPWATLGLPKGDAWGRLLRYSVSPGYAGGSTGSGLIDLSLPGQETKTVRTPRASDPAMLDNLASAVPAVVFSQGARNQGTTVDGRQGADSAYPNPDEDTNHVASQVFISRAPSDEAHPRGVFDDQMVWLSPYVLKSRLMQAGVVF